MGWKLKTLAVVFGLMLIPLGAWPFTAVLFLYAASGPIIRVLQSGRGGRSNSNREYGAAATTAAPGSQDAPTRQGAQPPPIGFKGSFGHPVRRILGVVFLGLAAVALTQGGTLSPFVFGGIGVVLLLWGASTRGIGRTGSLRAVDESILLRGSLDPFHWLAVAEVKLATRQVGKALSGIDETLLVTWAETCPSMFVILKATSLTMKDAEESLLGRFRELASISAPLGAYLLPLDSAKVASGLFCRSVERVELESRGWPSPLSTTDYDLLTIEARRGGFVHEVGAYKSSALGGKGAKATLPPASQALSRPALLWEFFQELGKKVEWQRPDGYTSFLASMFATEGEAAGQRVSEAGSTRDSQEVLVQSLGTPPVSMSRAQLRAIFKIYS